MTNPDLVIDGSFSGTHVYLHGCSTRPRYNRVHRVPEHRPERRPGCYVHVRLHQPASSAGSDWFDCDAGFLHLLKDEMNELTVVVEDCLLIHNYICVEDGFR